jgi:hypothetical protein
MFDEAAGEFVRTVLGSEVNWWSERDVRREASLSVPSGVLGSAPWILEGDVRGLWASWFVESLFDPVQIAPKSFNYVHLYARLTQWASEAASTLPPHRRAQLVQSLAEVLEPILLASSQNGRRRWRREEKLLLYDLGPRCWVCGAGFPVGAVDAFLERETRSPIPVRTHVDFMKPRGVSVRDLKIEVDHILPLSRGGDDEIENLRLSCGWCNRSKSAHTLLYHGPGHCRVVNHPRLGTRSVPQPFWTVRLLGLVRRCESIDGCDRSSDTSELTVAPRRLEGAANPTNMMVVCRDHDPLRADRLVPIAAARAVESGDAE